jgi:hypothetical protein
MCFLAEVYFTIRSGLVRFRITVKFRVRAPDKISLRRNYLYVYYTYHMPVGNKTMI